ncbi:MAG: discoidin domain-containing protein, partial [Myxococcales bacterium]|nr:discoidin domain-containing protein [Myxococcales bacterium]
YDGNVPANVLDGNLATRWSANGVGQYITVDLGANKQLCGMSIAWYVGNVRKNNFVISTSTNGTSFTNAFTGTSSGTTTAAETYSITTVQARYVRVTVNGNTVNNWASITELKAYGASTSASTGFAHPGVGLGRTQLDFVKGKIAAGQEPWKSAFAKLKGSSLGKTTYVARPVAEVRCAASTGKNYIAAHPELGLSEAGCAEQQNDSAAAYSHALAWYYTGDRAHAKKAVEILNAWARTLKRILFDQPRTDTNVQIFANGFHQAGWSGENFVRAAEIMRHTYTPASGETALDVAALESMFRNVYLPLTTVGGAGRGSWNGWGLNSVYSHMSTTIGIGVFLNDKTVYNAGVNEFTRQLPAAIHLVGDDVSKYTNLKGMPLPPQGTVYDKTNIAASSISQIWSSPSKYIDGIEGETCRDMSHTSMTFGSMGMASETARLQGTDLYGRAEIRMLETMELHAVYINAQLDGKAPAAVWPCPKVINMGGTGYKLGWEAAYNHYANRRKLAMPNTAKLVARFRPSGTGLHQNWETLTYAGVP